MNNSILSLSVPDLLRSFKRKELSPIDAVQVALEQARQQNPTLNAFVFLDEEDSLLRQARESEKRWLENKPMGALDGIPITIKDGSAVAGWSMRDGSLTTSECPVQEDAPVVARLRESGAIFLGKTTTPEFGHKGVCDSPLSGITRNPWNHAKTSGGSSGGAAVAAATCMGFLHLGTDGGGSVRIPASFCGVFGFKPTQGMISHQPQSLFSSIATSGPLARTVEDAALMLDVMSQCDPRDGSALPYERESAVAALAQESKNLRIAYAPTINSTPVSASVARLVNKAARKLESVGIVEEISLDIPDLIDIFNRHWAAMAFWIYERTSESDRKQMDSTFLDWAERGARLGLIDYLEAELKRLLLIDQMKALFNKYDLLVLPTMAMTAFEAGKNQTTDANGCLWSDWTPFTFPANLGKLPASSLPCGLAEDGLPVGIQIIGGFLKDNLVMQVSHVLERDLCFQNFLSVNYGHQNVSNKVAS